MEQQPSPPFMVNTPQPHGYTDPATHTSIAPFVGILLAVVVLGVAAVVVGRLCSGGRLRTSADRAYLAKYDMERWAERRCSSCIDGRLHVNSPMPGPSSSLNGASSEKDGERSPGEAANAAPTADRSPASHA
ncbi:hypothetical protein MLD38_034441 [Melastoma candidum]|uniref:Uncharacterized protein n=1 Tax=Melastoma candidum TaxID=119954 RepID=A0ACB9MC15_9MYRT|nr:hypothetical protein MLD38_034441 [Melastoma candidum]